MFAHIKALKPFTIVTNLHHVNEKNISVPIRITLETVVQDLRKTLFRSSLLRVIILCTWTDQKTKISTLS